MNLEPEKQPVQALTQEAPEAAKKKFSLFPKKEKKKKTVKQEVISWIITILSAVVIALVVRMFLFEPIRVDGESMLDTLQDGEIVYVSKPAYLRGQFNRGDVIICRYPNRNTQKNLNTPCSSSASSPCPGTSWRSRKARYTSTANWWTRAASTSIPSPASPPSFPSCWGRMSFLSWAITAPTATTAAGSAPSPGI